MTPDNDAFRLLLRRALNAHAQFQLGLDYLIVGQNRLLLLYYKCANNESCGKTVQIRSHAWAFTVYISMIRTIISWAGSCVYPDCISCPTMLILNILN